MVEDQPYIRRITIYTDCGKTIADDTKVWAYIRSTEDSQSLQKDLDSLTTWSNKWLLHFNPDNCKIMHIGYKFDTKYYMLDDTRKVELQNTSVEKDLGVLTTDSLKPSLQCQKSAAKARSVLGIVRRNFRKLNINGFLLIYKSYIRPHLEYRVQAWSPYHQKDIQCLESVQRAATKLVPSLKKLSYEDRLKNLRLTTLYQRRIRGDLIETYKILTRKINVPSDNFFRLHTGSHNTRGHSLKLSVQRSRLDLRKNFFSLRVVRIWNSLPQDVVNSTSVMMFKRGLDKHCMEWIWALKASPTKLIIVKVKVKDPVCQAHMLCSVWVKWWTIYILSSAYRTAGLIFRFFMLSGLNDTFWGKEVRIIRNVIWGNMPPKWKCNQLHFTQLLPVRFSVTITVSDCPYRIFCCHSNRIVQSWMSRIES